MSRTRRHAPHYRWFTLTRTRNRIAYIYAPKDKTRYEFASHGNRIPGVDDASYDDIFDNARAAQESLEP